MRLAKALVVDDSKVVQFKLSKMLQARGLGVHAAGSGKEALEYLTSNTPDVIFMDYMMSDMCGYQTTSIIMANPVTAAIPVIMCTGEDTPEARAHAQDTGASGFIVKPVDDHVLDQVLGALQEKAAASRPVAKVIPLPTTPPDAISASKEDAARFVERTAREVAERVVREAIAAITTAVEQSSQSNAQMTANRAVQELLADWRAEHTSTQERIETAAIAAAERAVQLAVQRALEGIEATRRAVEAATRQAMESAVDAAREVAEDCGREAINDAHRIAESLARESQDAAKLAIGDASRDMLQSARTILQDEHRNAAAAAASIAETVSRKVSEQVTRNAMDTAAASEAGARERLHLCAVAAAERVAGEILEKVLPATTLSNQSGTDHEAKVDPELAGLGENELRHATETDHVAAPRIEEETAGVLSDAPLHAGATGTDRVRPLTISAPMQRVLLPWLAGLTILVLYLLARIYVV